MNIVSFLLSRAVSHLAEHNVLQHTTDVGTIAVAQLNAVNFFSFK